MNHILCAILLAAFGVSEFGAREKDEKALLTEKPNIACTDCPTCAKWAQKEREELSAKQQKKDENCATEWRKTGRERRLFGWRRLQSRRGS